MNIPSSWIVSPDPVEIEVMGATLQVQEITADDYLDIVAAASGNGTFDGKVYCNALVRKMVRDPEIDPATLKPGIRAALVRKLETLLGITPDALKNSTLE